MTGAHAGYDRLTAGSTGRHRYLDLGWSLSVGAVAVVVALIGSWHTSLWTDEAATVSAASRSVADLWAMMHSIDVVHGSYYLFMHFWIGLFGQSAFALRLPSAVLVGVAAVLTVALARKLTDGRIAVTSGLLVAALPRVSWAGVEARPYAASIACAAAATSVLLTAVRRQSIGCWVAYGLLLTAGCYVNVYVALLGLSHLCSMFLDRDMSVRARKRWFLSAFSAGLLCAPLIIAASGQTGQLGSAIRSPVDWVRNVLVNQWFLGDTPTTTTGHSIASVAVSDVGSWWPASAVVLAVAGWLIILRGVVAAGRRSGSAYSWIHQRPFCWTVPWVAVPTVVIVGYSMLSPVYSPRYLSFAAPALAVLMAAGLSAIVRLRFRFGMIALLFLSTLPVYVSQRQLYGKNGSDWVSVAAFIADRRADRDCIYFSPRYPGAVGPIGQTTRGISVAYPDAFTGLRDLTLLKSPSNARNLTGESQPLVAVAKSLGSCIRVWVVERNDYPADDILDDEAALTRSGLRGVTLWRGPLDQIILFSR